MEKNIKMLYAVAAALIVIASPLLFLGTASAEGEPLVYSDGVHYDVSASSQPPADYVRQTGIVVTSVVSNNTYYGVSPVIADWDMGDGIIYRNTSEVTHNYAKEGKYTVHVTASNGQTWGADIVISNPIVDKVNNTPFILFAIGAIVIILDLILVAFNRIPRVASYIAVVAGIIILIIGAALYIDLPSMISAGMLGGFR